MRSGKIRIAFVITELFVGGAERILVNLATGLDRDRFSPKVYSLAPSPEGKRSTLVTQLNDANVDVRFINVTTRWQFLSAVRRLRGFLSEQSPHVVQSFLYHANIVGSFAGRQAGTPTIVSGVRVAEPSRFRLQIERIATRRVDRIVCVSEAVSEYMRSKASIPKEKIAVIPNGIDISLYSSQASANLTQLGIAAGRRAIVYIGRLTKQKGIDWLLRQATCFLAALPDHDLLLVGDGLEQKKIEQKVATSNMASRIHFAGWRSDIANIMRSSDLLVLPSRWEGMPNVLLEAMAVGIPVVSTRVSGVTELLGSLADQQSVPLYDADGFISRVVAIAQDQGYAQELGRQNQKRVVENFSLRDMINAYETLYERLLSDKK